MKQYENEFISPLLNYFDSSEEFSIREKIVSRNRIDLLIYKDGKIIGVEIKSSHDTPKRLKNQLETMVGFCDYVYLATEEGCIEKYKDIVGENVGILILSNGSIRMIKEANMCIPFPRTVLSFLLAEERRTLYKEQTGKEYKRGWTHEFPFLLEELKTFPVEIIKKYLRKGLLRAIEKRKKFSILS